MKKRFALFLVLLLAAAGIMSCALAAIHWDEGSQCYVDEAGNPVKDYWDEELGIYIDADGAAHPIEDADTGDEEGEGGATYHSGEGGSEDPSQQEESPGLTQEEWEARMQAALARNGGTTPTYFMGPEKDPVPVSVIYMGLARSRIQMRGREMMVNTCDLLWPSEVQENKALAVIDANRVGYAKLRAKTSQKAFIMDHCLTNRVVRVLSYGKTWCKVDYNGMPGYVLTGALTFHPKAMRTYTTGKIGINGRITGKSTINVRANPKNNSRILGDYVLGTDLTIFDYGEKWCEVDVEGWHCYILTEYVSLGEPEERASK